MGFKKIVLYLALLILILMVVLVVFAKRNSGIDAKWPPYVNKCPDYWQYNDERKLCNNHLKIPGTTETIPIMMTPGTDCVNYKWTQENGYKWDGISNNNELSKKCNN